MGEPVFSQRVRPFRETDSKKEKSKENCGYRNSAMFSVSLQERDAVSDNRVWHARAARGVNNSERKAGSFEERSFLTLALATLRRTETNETKL